MSGLQHPLSYKQFFPQFTGEINQSSEIEYLDNMIAEYFGIYGIPIDYFHQTTDPNKDRIFGEDDTKKFQDKRQLTTILKDGSVEESLLFNGFGQLNTIDFSMYLHINTWKRLIGSERDPLPGDLFMFPNNSKLKFEVTNVVLTTLGTKGNVFGRRTCYDLTCKEAELSPATEGRGEQYGVVDADGNLVPNAPSDAIVNDGSGRIADKYQVPQQSKDANIGDASEISKAAKDVTIVHNREIWNGWGDL
jgi:hypothetical protein